MSVFHLQYLCLPVLEDRVDRLIRGQTENDLGIVDRRECIGSRNEGLFEYSEIYKDHGIK